MVMVVAAAVRSGCAFSGGAAAGIVGDVGGGRDGAPRTFGCRAVIIAHVRACLAVSARWVLPVSDGWRCVQLMRAARGVFGSVAPPDL
jgi:hypothetical protein